MLLKLLIAAVALACLCVSLAEGHGYMKEPIARTSIQHRPEFNTEQPYWWDHTGVECGGQDASYSSCGRCGGGAGDTSASQGGIYDKGVIVATYSSGSVISVVSDLTASHWGHIEFELCPQATETNGCFQKLMVVGGGGEVRDGNRICVAQGGNIGDFVAQVRLPAGVRCDRCTLRWTYRTSYTPHGPQYGRDFCDDWGRVQVFRNCADVEIV